MLPSYDAGVYKKFRPITYPKVVETILDFMEIKLPSGGHPYNLAVDVGCGSGQHTVSLAPHFRSVVASDISETQVEEGRLDPNCPPNVTYLVGPGENLSHVADQSAELVTGGTSIHWLDLSQFYKEVDRVLVPNGVMAAVSQIFERATHSSKTDELNAVIEAFKDEYLSRNKEGGPKYVFTYYSDLPLPYPDTLRIEKMIFCEEKTVADLIGTLTSWSGFQAVLKTNPAKATSELESLKCKLLEILGSSSSPEETPLTMEFRYCFAMSRKPGKM